MTISGRILGAAAVLAIVTAPTLAVAQTPPPGATPNAQVDKLYNEAVAALDAGNHGVACPKLEEVIRLAPEAVGARITLGECYEAAGKLASAWGEYAAAEAMAIKAGQDARVKKAAAKAAQIKPKIATLTIEVPEAVRKLPGLLVTRDGTPLLAAQWGAPLPVDMGVHTVVVSATEHRRQTVQVDIPSNGLKRTVTVPLPEAEAPKSPAPLPLPSTPPVPVPLPRGEVPGFVLTGVGMAGMAAGGLLVGVAVITQDGIRTQAKDSSGNLKCNRSATTGEPAECAGLRRSAEAGSFMMNSGIGLLVGGGVVVAAGVLVYLLVPAKAAADNRRSFRVVPVIGNEGGGLLWTGSF